MDRYSNSGLFLQTNTSLNGPLGRLLHLLSWTAHSTDLLQSLATFTSLHTHLARSLVGRLRLLMCECVNGFSLQMRLTGQTQLLDSLKTRPDPVFSRVLPDSTPCFVGPLVHPSIGPLAGPSIHHALLFLFFCSH